MAQKKRKIDRTKLAKDFAKKWKGKGNEKSDTQAFWNELLSVLYGVNVNDKAHVDYEVPVTKNTSYNPGWKDVVINKYSSKNQVLVEQKSFGIDLSKKENRSGKMVTPFEQAKEYDNDSPRNEKANWIITCNFNEFWIYDLSKSLKELKEPTVKLDLEDLPEHLDWLSMVDDGSDKDHDATVPIVPDFRVEEQLSFKAGKIVGELYDELKAKYKEPDSEETLKNLNVLCVRLVFCLYAEDSGLFDKTDKNLFYNYLSQFDAHGLREAIKKLFSILDTPIDERDEYLDEEDPILASFPYVNGGLFHDGDEPLKIPMFTDSTKELLMERASKGFDWAKISPTIFGAVFESTLNPETRRSGGMHYTSIENIHKVIDPLFLDDLNSELDDVMRYVTINKDGSINKNGEAKLRAYQDKLANLTFLDPAAGSGNFLTETYLCLRRLENKVIKALTQYPTLLLDDGYEWVKVSIQQMYGIEINDFAVSVARTALWIAEAQMFQETQDIVNGDKDFLPLHTYNNIHEGNALRTDWNDVIPSSKLNYIMGNPPFLGKKEQSKEQKEELFSIYGKNISGVGNMDYVTGWYVKASEYIQKTDINVAFVSTNSITQGEQPPILWKKLSKYNVNILFAYRTFVWNSEASLKAHVHCVIIGFCTSESKKVKTIYTINGKIRANNINGYLIDSPNVLITSRNKPLIDIPLMSYGSMPIDNNNLILDKSDKEELINENPANSKFIKEYVGGEELLNGKKRWCLWLLDISPTEYMKSEMIIKRIQNNKNYRLNESKRPQTNKAGATPQLFGEIRQPKTDTLVIPKVSSENRKYLPIAYVSKEIIINGSLLMIPNASLYSFGILSSNVHNDWMRVVAGRMKSDYQYSSSVVYNNFPWPTPTEQQKQKIEQTAQAILDARNLYPDATLADMYDPDNDWMYPELTKAHKENDKAVMEAYGFNKDMSESEIVAELFKMYQKLVDEQK